MKLFAQVDTVKSFYVTLGIYNASTCDIKKLVCLRGVITKRVALRNQIAGAIFLFSNDAEPLFINNICLDGVVVDQQRHRPKQKTTIGKALLLDLHYAPFLY